MKNAAKAVVLTLYSFVCTTAYSQDLSGLFGTWAVAGESAYEKPQCGNAVMVGEARILQRITDTEVDVVEAYSGLFRSRLRYEKCDEVFDEEMEIFLFVDADKVFVTYVETDREQNTLVKNGDILEANWDEGYFRWTKIGEPTDTARANEARKNLAQSGYDEGAETFRIMMAANGYGTSDIEEIVWQYYDRRAACQVEKMIEVTEEMSLSFYEISNMIDPVSGGARNMKMIDKFDQSDYDARVQSCLNTVIVDLGINRPR